MTLSASRSVPPFVWRLRVCGLSALFVCLCLCAPRLSAASEDEETARLLRAGDAALGRGRPHYREALAHYTAALARHPDSQRARFSRAELLCLLRERAACVLDLDRVLSADPAHPRALRLRAACALQVGDLFAAAADTARLVALQRDRPDAADTARLALLETHAAAWAPLQSRLQTSSSLSVSEAAQCVRVLRERMRDLGDDDAVRLQRAACALMAGDSAAAAADANHVARRAPHNLDAAALSARALRALGALGPAAAAVRRCLDVDPEHAGCAGERRAQRAQRDITKQVEAQLAAADFAGALRVLAAVGAEAAEGAFGERMGRWRCDAAVGLRDAEGGRRACADAMARLAEGSAEWVAVVLKMVDVHILREDLPAAEAELRRAQEVQQNDPHVREYAQKLENLKRAAARKDYYKLLGVKRTAGAAEIRRAYRHLAKTLHPDKLRSQDLSQAERQKAETRFRDINEAKEILLDDEKRARYDNGEDPTKPPGQQGGHPFNGHPFPFPFDPFGGGGGGGGWHQGGGQQQFFFRFGG